jgi:zinc/manganese transport system substrate-binding protein
MKLQSIALSITGLVFGLALNAAAGPIRIVAALPDLGSIAAYIGGDKVEVSAIARANANPHSIEVFPSYMARVSAAALYLKCGMGLDQWSDAIIDGSRNRRLFTIDCSENVTVLEKPSGKVDASQGDVHPFGNPHYWLDPHNGIVIARNIAAGLQKVDQANAAYYQGRVEQFRKECTEKSAAWQERLAALHGARIITYHSSWAYLADAFGFTIVAKVEPFPGIPPSGNHLARLVEVIKTDKVAFILQEPYFADDAPRFLSRQTGVRVFKEAPSCADVKPAAYFAHFDAIVNRLVAANGGK